MVKGGLSRLEALLQPCPQQFRRTEHPLDLSPLLLWVEQWVKHTVEEVVLQDKNPPDWTVFENQEKGCTPKSAREDVYLDAVRVG